MIHVLMKLDRRRWGCSYSLIKIHQLKKYIYCLINCASGWEVKEPKLTSGLTTYQVINVRGFSLLGHQYAPSTCKPENT